MRNFEHKNFRKNFPIITSIDLPLNSLELGTGDFSINLEKTIDLSLAGDMAELKILNENISKSIFAGILETFFTGMSFMQ